jgi:hypothetical protein
VEGPLLNKKSDLSIRNAVLLYKQLIRPMMDYACPAWRSAARSHVRRLQVLQSKCLRLATGSPWYVSNRKDDKADDESSHSVSPRVTPGGIALSDSENAEALADNLEAQFQPVTDPSVPAVIEKVDVALRSYLISPASEPKFSNPEEVQEAIRELKVGKAPGPNGIPNRALKHLPQRAISLLVLIFNAILITTPFPTLWQHPRVMSILKPGKDPTLSSSYRAISLLDTIGKLFEKILLARILHEVNVRRLQRNEQFGFRPEHSTSLLLARLVEIISRNFGEKTLTGAVFLDVAKAAVCRPHQRPECEP